jgi:hypothetical protein
MDLSLVSEVFKVKSSNKMLPASYLINRKLQQDDIEKLSDSFQTHKLVKTFKMVLAHMFLCFWRLFAR